MLSELLGWLIWVFRGKLLHRRESQIKQVHVMLRKDTNAKSIVSHMVPVLQLQITYQSLNQSRFSCSVRADKSNPSAQVHIDIHTGQDWVAFFVADDSFVETAKGRRNLLRIWEHKHAGGVIDNVCDHINSLDGLNARLNKSCSLRIVSELVNELLNVRDLV